MELSKKGKISETNLSGVTYTMEELVNWGETYSGTDNDNLYKQNGGVIVCQKPDGNYYYYYMNDFFSCKCRKTSISDGRTGQRSVPGRIAGR